MRKGIILILAIVIAGSLLWLGCDGDDAETVDVSPAAGTPSGIVQISPETDSYTPSEQTAQPTSTPEETPVPSPALDPTVTAIPGPAPIPSPTATESPTPSPTPSPTATESPTPSPTADPNPSTPPSPLPTQADDEPVSFPDGNLESAIRDAIPKSSGDIYPSDLTGLTTLDASNSGVSDLTGLGYCTALSDLDLSHNIIEDISALVANTGLGSGDTVHLEYNPLSSASYGYVSQLTDRGVEVIWGSL